LSYALGPSGLKNPFIGYKGIQGGFEQLWMSGDRQRNRGFFSSLVRGVSNPCEGSKILSFLFRSHLVCSSYIFEARGSEFCELRVDGILRSSSPEEVSTWQMCL
jgi:hypothetical protein